MKKYTPDEIRSALDSILPGVQKPSRYLGIERKVIGQSQLDRLHGKKPVEVEVLVIEYAGQDRLFLPVIKEELKIFL